MTVYYIINLSILFIGFLYAGRIKSLNKFLIVCLFGLLFFFMAFRGNFTADYDNYYTYFLRVANNYSIIDILSFKHRFVMEHGFVLLGKIISYISTSKIFYHSVISAILLLLYFKGFKESKNIWLAIFVFVNLGDYFGAMNLFRQALCAAVIFAGYKLLIEKKYIKFILVICVAATIHTTALILIPLLLVWKTPIKRNKIIAFSCITVGAWIILPYFIQLVMYLFPAYQNYSYGMGGGSIYACFAMIAILLFVLYSIKFEIQDFDYNSTENIILFNSLLLALMFLILGVRVYMCTRIVYFFRPFVCVLVANILSQYKNAKHRAIFTVAICILATVYTIATLYDTGYNPYYFIWD